MRPSRGIQKTRDTKKKSRRQQPAGVWAEHGVVQRQESHLPYYRATKYHIFVVGIMPVDFYQFTCQKEGMAPISVCYLPRRLEVPPKEPQKKKK